MAYSVAKNTSFLTAASIGQKIISFVYFTVIARLIGVENTGQYFFALTFTSIFAVVADSGFSAVLTREIAKAPEKTQAIFSTVFGSKLVSGGVAYLLVILFVNLLGYPAGTRHLVYLAGLAMWFDNFHSLFYAVFRAKRNLKYESFGLVGTQLLTLIIGSVALYFRWPLIWLIAAYAIPSFCNAIYSGFFIARVCAVKLVMSFSKIAWKEFFIMAWPFALAGIIGRLYAYSDSIIMSKMLSGSELGWWSVPYKIVFAFQFIPLALSASVYPVFSHLFVSDKVSLARLFEKSWRYLLTIVLPLAAGIFVIAPSFIVAVYGANYAASVLPLRILVGSLIFGYLALISGTFINAIGQQKKQTSLMAMALVVNVIANLLLIPRLGIVGAAISALISNFLLWLIGLCLVRRYAEIDLTAIASYTVKAVVPAAIMAIIVYWLCGALNFIIAIPIGVVAYLIMLFITGALTKDIMAEIRFKIIDKQPYEDINNNA